MHHKLGIRGEEIAAHYLQAKGYTVLHKNWRKGRFEIDLVVYNSAHLIFVEVKTRSTGAFGPPEQAVNWKKKQNLGNAADWFLKQYSTLLEPRFDIISIIYNQGKTNIMHLEDAFWPGVF